VNSDMDVCAACKSSVEDMRVLVERYDRSKSVKDYTAFNEFYANAKLEILYRFIPTIIRVSNK
jgi:hypothetical protein